IRPQDPDIERSAESAAQFEREIKRLINGRGNHPSIVMWVPFNEGWGQHDTNEILKWTAEYDPTRLVDGPSGWEDRGWGHLKDMHVYPGPGMFPPMEDRVSALGEFGGLGWPVAEHLWWDKRNWGYRTYHSQEELEQNYMQLMRQLRPLIGRGLAAAIYTQTTDVEGEVNGLMTYDREIIKFDAEKIAAVHKTFYEPPPQVSIQPIVPTSEKEPQTWQFTTTKPADGWMQPGFDGAAWQSAPGGFGQQDTPGSVVRTEWTTPDVWLRRTFELNDAELSKPHLRIHHDEDAAVYINGVLAAKVTGYTTDYIEIELSDEARQALKAGTNTLAVHCRQTGGGQYIDVGL
ncbi:MAG: glycoside hydrolase family 2 TIM barrel-domain containing protein, partial [Vicinamibacterales bacterium]